jgi:hypothetical protein
MNFNLETNVPIEKINLDSFVDLYINCVNGFIHTLPTLPSNFRWYLNYELSKRKEFITIKDFFKITSNFFSKGTDFFIKTHHLEEIQSIHPEDKIKFQEYLKFNFHLGINFRFTFDEDFKNITYQDMLFVRTFSFLSIENVTSEEALKFLEKHNISTKQYELMVKFSRNDELIIYKAIYDNRTAICEEIDTLLNRNKQAFIDFHTKCLLTYFEKQYILLENTIKNKSIA